MTAGRKSTARGQARTVAVQIRKSRARQILSGGVATRNMIKDGQR